MAQHTQQYEEAKAAADKPGAIDYRTLSAPLPAMQVFTPKGTFITNESVRNDANLFVMLFNPTCEHCEDETELLKKNIALFKASKLVMIAGNQMMPLLKDFIHNHKIDQYPTIQIGVDSAKLIEKIYNYNALPQINVYDHNRKLIKVMAGDTPIDSLKQYIE